MARAILQQSAWNAGEFSPRLFGRSDFPKFAAGAKRLENVLIHPAGGFQNRSGTRFIYPMGQNQAAYSGGSASKKTFLVPFKFSTDDSYTLAFQGVGSDVGTIFFFRNGGTITVTSRTFGTANVNLGADTITITGHFFDTGQGPMRLTNGGGGLPGGTNNTTDYWIIKVDANTIKLATSFANAVAGTPVVDLNTSAGGNGNGIGAKSGVTIPAQVNHTFTETELEEVQWAQSADIMYLVQKSHAPQTLTRTNHAEWALANYTLKDGPYLSINTNQNTTNNITLTIGAINSGASGTVTASAALFSSSDVGRLLKFQNANTSPPYAWIWGTITAFTDTTHVTWRNDSNTNASGRTMTVWRFGAFYTGNYPTSVVVSDQRLFFGGEPNKPETIHSSLAGDYTIFSPDGDYNYYGNTSGTTSGPIDGTVNSNNGIDLTFGSSEVQAIRFMAAAKNLVVGTVGGIWPVRGGGNDEALTPTNAQTRRTSAYGAAKRMPIQTDDLIVHISRERRRLRAVGYVLDRDAYSSTDLNRLADHIGYASQFTRLAFQQEPDSTIWAVREDGVLCACALQREENVLGWARHTLGGAFGTGAAVCESVAVIPTTNADQDQVWVAAKRTVNGATVRSVELMDPRFESGASLEDGYFVDMGGTVQGTSYAITGIAIGATTTVTVGSTAGLSNGDRIRITGVAGVSTTDSYGTTTSLLNGKYFLVTNVTGTTFDLQNLSSVNYDTSSGSTYTSGGTAQKTLTSITVAWLPNTTIAMNADGSYQTGTTDGTGTLTLSTPAAKVQAGLRYTALMETLPIQVDDPKGSGQGRLSRPAYAILRLLRTTHLKLGTSDALLEDIPEVEQSGDPTTTASVLSSGDFRATVPSGWERQQGLILAQDYPLPWEQVSLMVHESTGAS